MAQGTSNLYPSSIALSMGRQPPTEQEFDILIIGAGPSAAGLLYGLLHRILLDRGSSDDEVSASSSANLSCVRIAILERGNSVDNIIACGASDDESTANNNNVDDMLTTSQFEHGHPSTYHLQNWFQTAHYNINNNNNNIPSRSHPTILYTTTPQTNLHTRIIDVPTGSGWGGGTNINAGLVMQPNINFRDDFDTWPGRWRGGDLIYNSMEEILDVMKKNGGLWSTSTSQNEELCASSIRHDAKQEDCNVENYCSNFQHPTLSSTPNNNNNNNNNRRVNYFTSLIAPLLQRHPELCKNVTFLSGVQVERILIRYSCCAAGDEDDNVCKQTQQQQQQKHQCKPQAWAVECTYGDHQHRGIIRSKRDIILCSGAIATPSLLLASGIGTEDDLRTAGIVPWYEQIKCDIHDDTDDDSNAQNVHRNLLVGHNLRDHILLPRIFITPRLCSAGGESYNSILGWWMIRNSTSSTADAKMQLQLADGIQMDYMIPHFAAGALRRQWVFPFAINLPQAWTESLFVGVRLVLRVILCIPLLSKWAKQHFVSLNLCLLNPKSTGRVTVRSSKGIQTRTRLSDCKVIIDPNYLSDSGDVESLWKGWTYSSRMKQRWFKRGVEILPGYTFSIGFAACSLIRSAIHWAKDWAKVLLGWKLHDESNETHSGGNAPLWFRRYAAEFSNPYYHWCGTCAMGGEEDSNSTNATTSKGESVVDEYLCVRGLSNLRICDASVFPDSVSAPPALTCASLGHAASSFINE
jgi:choline dehydrogenase-like flavoprotein